MKIKKIFVPLILLLVLLAVLTACNFASNGPYFVTYVVDGNVEKTATISNFAEIDEFYTPNKTGFDFVGWFFDKNFENQFIDKSKTTNKIILYAKFTQKTLTVDFVANGKVIDSQSVLYGESAVAPNPPELDSYTFDGWDKDFDCVTDNLTINAIYSQSSSYVATFTLDGKTIYTAPFNGGDKTATIAEKAVEYLDIPDGLEFFKWTTLLDKDITEKFPSKNITYKAVLRVADIGATVDSTIGDTVEYTADTLNFAVKHKEYGGITYGYTWYIDGTSFGNTKEVSLPTPKIGEHTVKVIINANSLVAEPNSQTLTHKFEVTPATVNNVSVKENSAIYDGKSHSLVLDTMAGDVVEYSLDGNQWTKTLSFVNAGEYDVYVKLTRANYLPYQTENPIKFTIQKRNVTGVIAPTTISYGDDLPTSYKINYSGFIGNDNQSVFSGAIAFTPSIDNSLALGTFSVSGDATNFIADNYTLSLVDGTLNITKRVLVVTAENKDIEFGDDMPMLTISYVGFAPGENTSDLDTVPTLSCSYVAGVSPIGKYTISVVGGSGTNYQIIAKSGTLAVSKKSVTITADDGRVTYGNAFNTTNHKYTHNGILSGDTVNVTYTTNYSAGSGADKTYTITPHASHPNYVFKFVAGTLTVERKSATITLSNATVKYGNHASRISATVDGVINGDTLDYAVYCDYIAGVSPVGIYPISATLGINPNYDIIVKNGTLTVEKRQLTFYLSTETEKSWSNSAWYNSGLCQEHTATGTLLLTSKDLGRHVYPTNYIWSDEFDIVDANNESVLSNYESIFNISVTLVSHQFDFVHEDKTVVYDGKRHSVEIMDIDPSVTDYTVAYRVADGNWQTTAPHFTNAGSHVVEYRITAGTTTVYGNITLTILPKELTVTVDNAVKIYGNATPTFTGTVDGIVSGDNVSIAYHLANNVFAKNAGTYVITASFDGAHPNYTLKVINGTYTIEKRKATVQANDMSVFYSGKADFNGHTSTISGVIAGDTVDVNYTTNYRVGDWGGTYTITPHAVNDNYTFTLVNGKLTVKAFETTVIWQKESSYSYTGKEYVVSAYFYDAQGNQIVATISVSGQGDKIVEVGDYILTATAEGQGFILTNATAQITVKKADYVESTAI